MARMGSFYLTTAIDYSNGEPHLGHTVEKVGADVIARYRRSMGDDVHFLIGMDENGQKVGRAAENEGIDRQEWVDHIARVFLDAWRRLEISHDDFIRTTEPRHHSGVHAFMRRIESTGDFYAATYSGYYCAGCEAFKKEEDLVDGQCPIHPQREIEWTEEENFFFKLSEYRDRVLEHIRTHPEFVRPASRRNEILRLLEGGLDDISASRSRIPWGVTFPGDESHTVYVWFDALPNYITAIGYPGDDFDRRWPAQLHIIGKDITRFHCVIWPAMLMSAGVQLPQTVWAHGFINIGGGKLSKSDGKQVELTDLIDRHGPDALRYFLMREVPWDGDRDFSSVDVFLEQFDKRYTADLANDLGNLLNRVVSMVDKYRGGEIPQGGLTPLDERGRQTLAAYHEKMDLYLLHQGLETAFEVVRAANAFVDESQPWALARAEKDGGDEADRSELDAVLGSLVRALGSAAAMLAPFMPGKANQLWKALGGGAEAPSLASLAGDIETLERVSPGPVLFPRPE
jgi:methionyl-tRNA synthetase